MREIWIGVKRYKGLYEVSNYGRVKSLARTITRQNGRKYTVCERILKTPPLNGYAGVSLSKEGQVENLYVHILVMEAFVGKCPIGYETNHKDGNKLNARLDNLEYISHSGNMRHAFANGLSPKGEDRSYAKLTQFDVETIRSLRGKVTGLVLAKRFGVSPSLISHIQLGKARV